MRIRIQPGAGFALAFVMAMIAISLLALSSIMIWTSASAERVARQNSYHAALAAAEAATEKLVAHIGKDFQRYGITGVDNRRMYYPYYIPTSQEDSIWANYEFSDDAGNINRIGVAKLDAWQYTNLLSKYPGLSGYASTYRIVARARDLTDIKYRPIALQQDIQLASIPFFQYQIFYALDLEIHPSGSMRFNGPVHGNGNIYSAVSLNFENHVTASQEILNRKHPDDPSNRGAGQLNFLLEHDGGTRTLNVPIGSPGLLRQIIEIPPSSESVSSPLGQQRLYNKADLIILVSNGTSVAKSGAYNNFATLTPWSDIADSQSGSKAKKRGKGAGGRPAVTNNTDRIVNTNATFFNKREGKTVQATELDVNMLIHKYSYLTTTLGRQPRIIYIGDFRTQSSSTQSGVRIVYGQSLPASGLTIVSPNPLYVEGDYNAPDAYRGTSDTTGTAPAALIGDAITILSGSWNDDNSGATLSYRVATNTTVNAAMLTGIVPTGGGYYSGGVENATRFLEDWKGKIFAFNGSMVVLFPSQMATAPWGATAEVYSPPQRNWSFDLNFRESAKLPPGAPEARTVVRSQWQTVAAN